MSSTITLAWDHIVMWLVVLLFAAMVGAGFAAGIGGADSFEFPEDMKALGVGVAVLMIAGYMLGYLR